MATDTATDGTTFDPRDATTGSDAPTTCDATTTGPEVVPPTMRQIRSLVTADGHVELSIATLDTPAPAPDEVLVRIEAAPVNPSDLGLLLATADLAHATSAGSATDPVVRAPIAPAAMAALAARVGVSMPVGNEAAGTVVAAGDSDAARALLGRTVAVTGGAMYSEYRAVPVNLSLTLPPGTTAQQGASSFVNPMTALCMVETMRLEHHGGLVHTAAASNLGQMLDRICRADGIPLVNVVRRPEQVDLLRAQGATHVCDTSSPSFRGDLVDALRDTGATLAFDAVGGGRLMSQILAGMETAALSSAEPYNRYGSTVHKQGYFYGSLDRGPSRLDRNFGMAWGVGGWLLTPFLGRLGREGIERLGRRVIDELDTTFVSRYTHAVSLAGALDLEAMTAYARQATGQKFLIEPGATTRPAP